MIIRRRHNGRFAALPNAIWVDPHLSVEAKGVLGYLLSRPNNWNVRLTQVASVLDVGKDKLQRIFRELRTAGYVTREQPRAVAGAFGSAEYIVRDEPLVDVREDDVASLPQPENPVPVNPALVNTAAYKDREELNTDFTKPLTPIASSTRDKIVGSPLGQTEVSRSVATVQQHQNAVVARLGNGEVATGWQLFAALSDGDRDQLVAQQRMGRLSEDALCKIRLSAGHLSRNEEESYQVKNYAPSQTARATP